MPYRVTGERYRYTPGNSAPFKLSRTKLELFLECPRCFYLDRRLSVGRVGMPAFTLNSATDALLKKEFDQHRAAGTPHPMMMEKGIDAVPFQHPEIDDWRDNFKGVQVLHDVTNLLLFGAVDDVWQAKDGSLIIVDYKSTSTTKDISLDDPWKQAYKRQMEIYQWLLRRKGFAVSPVGYFLFVNATTDRPAFDGRLEFVSSLIPYEGDDSWVGQAVLDAYACLQGATLPAGGGECEWCAYREAADSASR